ncbi:MAG: hypothetical protein RMJ56_07215 [Gemmataceae bacterium]|nr:hypothetical protein [Gemmata sp.]MDW8197380.1 hypothetical protein [Gemmataceae bacterium]
MRKMLLALFALVFMAGLVVAVEVTVVSYDKEKKELKVKEGDKENTYKITDKTKFTVLLKDEAKESNYDTFEKRVTNPKAKNVKLDITTDGGNVTEVKWKAGGGKGK